ncbi:MAG: hypothetical protein MO853_12025 [Candidatus Protistobacter heckmanni]|nr:hypothetical protein [Candidatus Protistobacter heckmanni]
MHISSSELESASRSLVLALLGDVEEGGGDHLGLAAFLAADRFGVDADPAQVAVAQGHADHHARDRLAGAQRNHGRMLVRWERAAVLVDHLQVAFAGG